MDEMYLAKYKIIKWLHNNVEKDTIEFVSFDHYGIPAAFNSKTPILYLGYNEKKGEYFQYKYQFDDAFIYKNKWVGIYNFRSISKFGRQKMSGRSFITTPFSHLV